MALRAALARLDQSLQGEAEDSEVQAWAEAVAQSARDSDQYTLISLLLRHPRLASGALYPRLAEALHMPADDADHRKAWILGDRAAMERWWRRLPS